MTRGSWRESRRHKPVDDEGLVAVDGGAASWRSLADSRPVSIFYLPGNPVTDRSGRAIRKDT